MIRLQKIAQPDALDRNGERWTREYVAASTRARRNLRHWADPDIKSALLEEVSGRCAYCESRILAIDFGDVEHILPKSVFPDLVLDWANLTLVCSRCNGAKRDKYDAALLFVNPYSDDPAQFFVFFGSTIFARPGQDRGRWTIQEIDLNRIDLVESREKSIKGLLSLLDSYQRSVPQLRTEIRNSIDDYVKDEYTAMLTEFLVIVGVRD